MKYQLTGPRKRSKILSLVVDPAQKIELQSSILDFVIADIQIWSSSVTHDLVWALLQRPLCANTRNSPAPLQMQVRARSSKYKRASVYSCADQIRLPLLDSGKRSAIRETINSWSFRFRTSTSSHGDHANGG